MRGWRGVALIAFAVAGLSGCTTANIDDVVPVAAAEQGLPEQTAAIPTPTPAGGDAGVAVAETAAVAAGTGQPAESAAAEAQGLARLTGQFPNLNIVPTAAAPQLTGAEKRAKLAELDAARKQAVKGASGEPVSDDAKLKKLARTHAEDALKEIEGQ